MVLATWSAVCPARKEIPVRQAMSPGPSTVRPSIGTDALLERIRARKLTSILVTTPDGRLVGLALRDDLG